MKYDFTSMIDRVGWDSIAADLDNSMPGFMPTKPMEGFDFIPMWVADMNFATAPGITEALQERLTHPLYGYFNPRAEYFNSIIRWQEVRNGVTGLEAKHIGYENGVLGGLVSTLRAMGTPGDKILLHSPTYVGFTGSITASGYTIVHSQLEKDENGVWRMNFEDMEAKLRDQHIHLAVFCSPHNPCGRVWERWELERAMELYKKYDVTVISDEIWSDFILKGKHIPTQSVSEDARNRVVALYAPSKTFNLAGLIGSYHIIYNDSLRDRVRRSAEATHYNSMNVLSMHALIGAYRPEGYEWVDELVETIRGNVRCAVDFIRNELNGITLSEPEGTYMIFMDCEEWCKAHNKTLEELLHKGWDYGVGWQDGRPFHGAYCIRLNLALPLSRVQEALDRMKKYIFAD